MEVRPTSENFPSTHSGEYGKGKGRSPVGALSLSKALRLLALYLKEPNFVPLHAGYRVVTSLRRLFAQAVSRLLGGTHGFFTLPEGDAKRLAAVAVDEGDHTLEALHQPPPWQNNLPCLAQSFVNELLGTLQETHPRMHGMPPFSHLALRAHFKTHVRVSEANEQRDGKGNQRRTPSASRSHHIGRT